MSTPCDGHDLGLSAGQEQRAVALGAACVVVDLLATSPPDSLTPSAEAVATEGPPPGRTVHRADVDPTSFLQTPQPPAARATLPVARTVGEIRAAARDGRHVVYLGAGAVADPIALDALHRLGLRTVGFDERSAKDLAGGDPLTDASGLTAHGDRLLRRIDRLGIVVDVADCDRATAFDIAMRSAHPVVASRVPFTEAHAAGSGLGPDELRAIASTDGAIGVGLDPRPPDSPVEREPSDARTSITTLLDRIDRVAALVGSRYVALGIGDGLPAGPSHGALTHGLVARGYTDDEILGILGENALRVFAAVWG